MPYLVSVTSPGDRREHALGDSGTLILGSGEPSDVRIHGHMIAARHLRISAVRGRVTIHPKSSYGLGMVVGSTRRAIEGRTAFEMGTLLRVGAWTIELGPMPGPFVPRGPIEASLLASLDRDPDNEAVRAVYSDWLEETGHDGEAAYLRALDAPTRLDEVDLSVLAARAPYRWRQRAVGVPIENCRAAVTCPGTWGALEGEEDARPCAACSRTVLYAGDMTTARIEVHASRAVAVDPALVRYPYDLYAEPAPRRPAVDMGRRVEAHDVKRRR